MRDHDDVLAATVETIVWADKLGDDGMEGQRATIQLERVEPNEIAMHLMIDGTGSWVSYYFDREKAIELATALLNVGSLR